MLDEKIVLSDFAAEHRDPRQLYELKDESKLKSEFISYLSLKARETQVIQILCFILYLRELPFTPSKSETRKLTLKFW